MVTVLGYSGCSGVKEYSRRRIRTELIHDMVLLVWCLVDGGKTQGAFSFILVSSEIPTKTSSLPQSTVSFRSLKYTFSSEWYGERVGVGGGTDVRSGRSWAWTRRGDR